MKHTYKIEGMTCESCAAKIRTNILAIPHVIAVKVNKADDLAMIEMSKHISIVELRSALQKMDPKYSIYQIDHGDITEHTKSWFQSYKPILLVFFYILLVTLLIQFQNDNFNFQIWMRHFMSAFFIVFSFFKLLDLSGFADSYTSYDIIAKRWRGWAFVYAFIELGLGVSYIFNCCPMVTNIIAFTVMSVSIIGVLQSVLSKQKIQCACLGAVFDLPMSTITIIEDALMIAMSGYMIIELV